MIDEKYLDLITWHRHEDIINDVQPGTLSRIQLEGKEKTSVL